jgi:IS605 OrfB family transposase
VSFDLKQPVTIAVVDVEHGKVIHCQTAQQLLKTRNKHTNQSHLLNRQRNLQLRHSRERHLNLKRGKHVPYQEADIGVYLDRLLAKQVIDIAVRYKVDSIALSNTVGLRDKLESQLRARAESQISSSVATQKQYAQSASQRIHHWSYKRLSDCIHSRAAKIGIPVETVPVTLLDTPQSTAGDLAMSAYHHRQATFRQ